MKNKFTKKNKNIIIIKDTQGMAQLSLAVVLTILSSTKLLISSAPCARMLSFFGALFNGQLNQFSAHSTSCARALSGLWVGFGKLKNRASSTSCARALSLLGIFVIVIGSVIVTVRTDQVTAATSNQLNFQGRLLTSSGDLVPDGNYHVEFKLYNDTASAGTPDQGACTYGGGTPDAECLWTETRSTGNLVSIQNGYYSVYLGDVTALPNIDWSQDLYLGMNIGGSGGGASWDGEMTPRFKLTAVPYAFRASNVASSSTNSASLNSDAVSITSGNALGVTSNSGNITVDTGTATGTAGSISLGSTNASALYLGRTGITTTNNGALTVTQQLTANGNLTISGGTDYGVYYRDSSDNLVTTAAGATGECFRGTTGAAPIWGTCAGTGDIVQNGNSFTATMTIGTNDAYDLVLETSGTPRITVSAAGTTTFSGPVVLAASQSLTVTGGNTASRPGSPTEGMVYFDTDTDRLMTYSNGKWQTDNREAILVAASNSSQADKDAADYVADGNGGGAGDGDQIQINSALTAGSGRKVVLLAGTYVADATISIPNNTTLAGVGAGTIIELADLDVTDNLIENTDTATGTGITIRDLKLDGRNDLNTAGTQYGIYFNTGSSSNIESIYLTRFRNYSIYLQDNSNRNTFDNVKITSGSGDAGIGIDASDYNMVNNINVVGAAGLENGVEIIGGESNTVTGSTFSGSFTERAINMNNGAILNTVSANTVNGTLHAISSETNSGANIITGNTIFGTTGAGIVLNFNSDANTVTNNSITLPGTMGIYAGFSSDNNTIDGNTIVYPGGATENDGIVVDGDANQITDNYISDSTCSTACTAIEITSNADNTYISGNMFVASSGVAIISNSGTDTTYGGQTVAENGLSTVFRQADSTTAFAIQNNAGSSLFNADTSGGIVTITGSASVSGDFTVDTSTLVVNSTTNAVSVGGTLSVTTLGSADTSTFLCRNTSNQLATCSSTPLTNSLTDNITDAFDLQEGTNNYFNINTTNSSENISFGNATTNPSYSFLGSGTLTVAGNTVFTGDVAVNGNDITSTGDLTITPAGGDTNIVSSLAVDTNTLFVDATGNRVGIGQGSPSTARLEVVGISTDNKVVDISGEFTDYSVDNVGVQSVFTINPGGDASAIYYSGSTLDLQTQAGNTNNLGNIQGQRTSINIADSYFTDAIGSVTTVLNSSDITDSSSYVSGGAFSVANFGDGDLGGAYGVNVSSPTNLGAGVIGEGVGLRVRSGLNIGSGSITDNYGIFVENQTAGASDYGLYIQGADTYALFVDAGVSRFDGLLRVGSGGTPSVATGDGELYVQNDLEVDGVLDVAGASTFGSTLAVTTLGSADTATFICRNTSNQLASCNYSPLNASLADNIADALDIQEGTNNYFNINTTNSSENISFGNATTNPSYSFLGTSVLSVDGGVSIGDGLAVTGNSTFTGRISTFYTTTGDADYGNETVLEITDPVNPGQYYGVGSFLNIVSDANTADYSLTEFTSVLGTANNMTPGLTIPTMVGVSGQVVVNGDGSTVTTNAVALLAKNSFEASGTITNGYGLYVENQTTATNDYGIYVAGADTYALFVDAGATRLDGTLEVQGLATLTGGLTVETGDNFTFNGDVFTDFTGGGLVNTGGVLTVDTTTATGFFQNGGNTFTADATLGVNANYALNIETNSLTRLTVQADGDVAFDTATLFVDATNDQVSVGTASNLGAKLAVVGTADQEQLLIRAYSSQTLANPLILLQNSAGTELARINVDGSDNIAFGLNTLDSISGGSNNIGIGASTLSAVITGSSNIAIGGTSQQAGTGSQNVSLGVGTLSSALFSGSWNTAIGDAALQDNEDGVENTAVGRTALGNTVDGSQNTAVGNGSLGGNISGAQNTAIGNGAGSASTGGNNVFIGYNAGDNLTSGSGNIIIGSGVDASAAGVSNELRIGGVLQGDTSTLAAQFNGALVVTGLTTLNGGLTVEAGDTFTFNGDAFTDLTGSGLTVSSNALTVDASSVTGFFQNGGNDFGGNATLGTNTAGQSLILETANTTRFTVDSAAATITGTGATTLTSTAALTLSSAAASDLSVTTGTTGILTLDSGSTGTVNLGTNANAKTINIGTGAAVANSINLGGTGANIIAIGDTQTAGSISIGAAMTTGTISIGGTGAQTGTISLGTGTGVQTINLGTGSAAKTINLGTTTSGSSLSLNSDNGININSQALTFSTGGHRAIALAQAPGSTNGYNLSISAGGGGGGGTATAGGVLTLQGGAAGQANGNGGNVALVGGVGAGSGVKGLVVADTFALSTASLQTSGSSIAITQANVDSFGAVLLSASSTGVTYTLGDPTLGVSATGRIIYITNAGATNDFVLSANGGTETINLKPNTTATMIWNGSDWTAAGASSATDLQAAYDNTAATAGGAEIVLRSTLDSPAGTGGLTIRNNETVPIVGGLLEVQSSIGSNLFAVNNNSTEYASNGGAESSTFTMWTAAPTAGGTITRYTTAGDNIATGAGSVSVDSTSTANTGVRNTLTSTLTRNLKYRVSFAIRHTSSSTAFSTLDVRYSPSGTNTDVEDCSTGNTVNYGQWTRITCTFIYNNATTPTSSNAILITHSDAVDHDYYIDNFSTTVSADVNHAIDGSVDSALGTNWVAIGGSVARSTSVLYDTSGSVAATTSGTAGRGVYNNLTLGIIPQISTQYRVAFYARGDGTNTATLAVAYTPDNNSTSVSCTDYSTQIVSATAYTLVTCLLTTSATTPVTSQQLRITQTAGSATVFYVDALTMTLNTNNANNVQIGGANKGGPVTLFTLDRSAGAPIAANNDAYLGSMYYDTTSGRIQCYEADGWGACGAAPDNIVNLNPEYAGAVLNGTGVGTMTADFCATELLPSPVISVNPGLCAEGEARNFYKWTSPQATSQTYSIFVTYQLPATFNGFSNDDTVQLTARVDSTSNAEVTYEMFKSTGSEVTLCGTGETDVIAGGGDTPDVWHTYGVNGNEATGCSFNSSSAGNFVIFKINMSANSNANAYVSTLNFVTTGR